MLNALRYYDLTNAGSADLKQFQQFVGRFGIQIYNAKQLETIFQDYDYEQDGAIPHKVLIARILGRPEPQSYSELADSRMFSPPTQKGEGRITPVSGPKPITQEKYP